MKIIEEIKRDKLKQESMDAELNEKMAKKRAEESKFEAQNFKDQKQIEKIKADLVMKRQQEEQERQQKIIVRHNKEFVQKR